MAWRLATIRPLSQTATSCCSGTFRTSIPRAASNGSAESLRLHVRSRAKVFASDYDGLLPAPIETDADSATVLDSLTSAVRKTPYKLYLLIDEYDNFVNEVMAKDVETYRALFELDGPYKQLFKSIKNATEGQGLERVFVTGVSPVALNDLTSGFNTAENVSLRPELAALCGFQQAELRDLLEVIAEDQGLEPKAIDETFGTMRTWYNGYRFAAGETELLYNPTNALYFLKNLQRYGVAPEQLHDQNLRTDRGKLAFLARTAAGAGVIEQLTEGADGSVDVTQLEQSFSLDDLTARMEKDPDAVASFLYYMGLLTQTEAPFRLRIPNMVVRKLFLDRLLEIFLPDVGDSSGARRLAMRLFREGDLPPLLAFFEDKLLPVLSNRDRGAAPRAPGLGGSGVNEMVVKSLFLSILFEDTYYQIFSEPELEKTYADLCLLVRPEMRRYGFFDLLFEFKLVRRKELGKKGRELAGMDAESLRRLPRVEQAFDEARQQLELYRQALSRRHGDSIDLRSYAVVAVGLERMLGEEVSSGP